MSDKIANLTTDSFKSAIAASPTPVLVDFWAPWSKVNIDDNDAVAAEFGVRAIPTMILFKGGKVAETLVGMMPKAALKAKLTGHLA